MNIKARIKANPVPSILLALVALFLTFRVYAHAQQDNVMEAIVLDTQATVLDSLPSSTRATAIFISINGEDPANDFLKRFSNNKVLVYKASQATQGNDSFGDPWATYAVDKVAIWRGTLLSMGSVSWQEPFRAQVEVNSPGRGERFTVVLTLYGWSVTQHETTWIA